jgi:hypothetical protein
VVDSACSHNRAMAQGEGANTNRMGVIAAVGTWRRYVSTIDEVYR